jgi:hypothetical protein
VNVSQHRDSDLGGDEHPNAARVRRALAILKPHLDAHVRQTLVPVPGARVSTTADVQELLKAMLANPVHFFTGRSGDTLRAAVQVIRDARNRAAHEQSFTERETRQIVDTAAIVLESIGAPREIVAALDALVAPTTAERTPTSKVAREALARPTTSKTGASVGRVRRDTADVIVNAEDLTAADVVMQRVLCPPCHLKVFEEWSAGWDAHAASPTACRGLTAIGADARKAEFRARFEHLFRPLGWRGGTQRDVMRAIWARCAPDEERAIREYGAAEMRGDVRRKNNTSNHRPEQYARALLFDGLKKG